MVQKPRFQYQQRTKEDIKERANNRGGNFDSIFKSQYKIYKVREGKNVVRILPPTWVKPKHYGLDIWVNYGIGADNQSYLSLAKMKNQKDPIAEARIVANREGDEKLARALQPTQRILMWVIDRNAEDEGPQLWPAAFTVDRDAALLSFDEDTKEVSFIDDPENGRDFRFHTEGTGMQRKYPAAKMKLLTEGPLSQDAALQDEWLEFAAANPLPDVLQFYDYAYIAGVFDGQARVAPDEDEAPKAAPRKPSPKINNPEIEDDHPGPPPLRPVRQPVRPPPDLEPEPDEDGVIEDVKPAGQSIRDRLKARHSVAAKSPTPDDDD